MWLKCCGRAFRGQRCQDGTCMLAALVHQDASGMFRAHDREGVGCAHRIHLAYDAGGLLRADCRQCIGGAFPAERVQDHSCRTWHHDVLHWRHAARVHRVEVAQSTCRGHHIEYRCCACRIHDLQRGGGVRRNHRTQRRRGSRGSHRRETARGIRRVHFLQRRGGRLRCLRRTGIGIPFSPSLPGSLLWLPDFVAQGVL
jgi:hypothetical protein